MFETTQQDELKRLAKEIEKIGQEMDSTMFFKHGEIDLDVPIVRLTSALVALKMFRELSIQPK
jgi:hypothetical protein